MAALNLLEEAAETRPVLVIADDAHWFDEATALALSFIARRLSRGIVFAAAYRDDFDSAFQRSDLPELTIAPLSARWAAALLTERAPGLSDSVRRAVLREAQGNPLALIELPLGWRERPAAIDADGFSLTSRLQRSFAARALSLPTTTQTALLIAALNDDESLAETLRATERVHPSESALAALEIAERAQLVSLDRSVAELQPSADPCGHSAGSEHRASSRPPMPHSRRRWPMSLNERSGTPRRQPSRPTRHWQVSLSPPHESARRHRGTLLALRALLLAADLSDSQERRGDRLISAAELALELGQEQEMERLVGIAGTLRLAPP